MIGWVRGQIWAIPLLFTLVVGAVGWGSYRALEADHKAQLAENLQTILNADVTALRVWIAMHGAVVAELAEDPRVGALVTTLAETARGSSDPRQALLGAPALSALRELLEPTLRSHGYPGFAVVDPFGLRLAAAEDGAVGRRLRGRYDVVQAALEGRAGVSRPLVLESEAPDAAAPGEGPAALAITPVLLAVAPVRSPAGEIVAAIGTGVSADLDFTEILTVARMGETGETYAFDADGSMLSHSRFDDQLVAIGLLPDRARGAFDPDGPDSRPGRGPRAGLRHRRAAARASAHAHGGRRGDGPERRRRRWLPGLPRRRGGRRLDLASGARHGRGDGDRRRRGLRGAARQPGAVRDGHGAPRRRHPGDVPLLERPGPDAQQGGQGAAPRPLSHRREDRRRGHGQGLPSAPRAPAPPHRHQAAQIDGLDLGGRRTLRARGAGDEWSHAPEHDRGLRLRSHARGHLLLRNGVPGRDHGRAAAWRRTERRTKRAWCTS